MTGERRSYLDTEPELMALEELSMLAEALTAVLEIHLIRVVHNR